MQVIGKDVQDLGVEEKLIRRPLEFFRYERKNRGDGLCGCATTCQKGRIEWNRGMTVEGGCATLCQRGRSMIEMLGVLAIIGVLSVGGIMGYSKAMMRYKINKTIEQITYIAGNVRTTFASQGNYQGLNSDTDQGLNLIKKAHILPDDMQKNSSGRPISLWDGSFSIWSESKNSADTQGIKAFQIYDDGDPSEEVCIELLTHDWKNAQVKMIEIYSGNNTVLSIIGHHIIPPAKLDDAVKLCDDGGNRNNDYEFHYYFEIDTSDPMYKNLIDETTATLAGS